MEVVIDKINELVLRQMFPQAGERLKPKMPYIVPAMRAGHIVTADEIAAFLAQLGHESGDFRYQEELADGMAYEGRTDLSNIYLGDGPRFKGHGDIQITGRRNHELCGKALGVDAITYPKILCLPENSTRAAVWFWNTNQIGYLARQNWFIHVTKKINGGTTGLEDRILRWDRNRQILGLPKIDTRAEDFWVREFQKRNGLVVDGIAGPGTIARLKVLGL